MTYRIALCDDEPAELDKAEELLGAYEKKRTDLDFMIERFESADELLYMIRERKYAPDLIFMDIFMPGSSGEQDSLGMKAAKSLRNMGIEAGLFFLTTSKEYALEAFDVEASQYLLKPLSEKKLSEALDRFRKNKEEERKKYIVFKSEGKLVKVAADDIVYCEAQGKEQCLHLSDNTKYMMRMTMTELFDMLSTYPEFVRIGVSYIANLEYVGSISTHEVSIQNGDKVYLPRGTYKAVKEAYFKYYCGN